MSEPQHTPPQPEPSNLRQGLSERGIGVFTLIAGCVLSYDGIIEPILSAMHHEPQVSMSMTVAGIEPLVLALGVVYSIFGDATSRYLGLRQRPSALGWAFYITFFIVGFLAYLWFQNTVRSYGYDV